MRAGIITIFSNDTAGPHTVLVSGTAPAPKANLIIANTGNFGKVCVGSFADEPLVVTNSGKCTLTVTGIASSSGEFLAPQVLSYPITIGPGDALPVPIRFQPTSFGPKSATITLSSDDPVSPLEHTGFGHCASWEAHHRRFHDFRRGERMLLCGPHALRLQYWRLCPERHERSLQAEESPLEAAAQSVPREIAPRLVPAGGDPVPRHRAVLPYLRTRDRERRSGHAGKMRRGAGVHDLGLLFPRGMR